MNTILLITEGFPYGISEKSFLNIEYKCLHEKFNVAVLAKDYGKSADYNGYMEDYHELYTDNNKWHLIIKVLFKKDVLYELRRIIVSKKNIIEKFKLSKACIGYATGAYALMSKLRRIILSENVDIVYTYWCGKATLAALWLKKEFSELCVISRFHGIDLYNERVYGRWQFYRSYIAKELDELYFVSKDGKEYFERNWGRTGKIRYIGTKKQEIIYNENYHKNVIVSCSGLINLKRVDLIIRALSYIPDKYRIEWHHIGDGEQRDELYDLADKLLKNKSNITYKFEGWIENEEITNLYKKIKPVLFITTSSTEGGSPVSIQEAFSLGIPGLGTNIGGIPDIIIDKESGILISANPDPSEVRDAMIRYFELPSNEKKHMRINAYKIWNKKFNAEVNAEIFVDEVFELKESSHMKGYINE